MSNVVSTKRGQCPHPDCGGDYALRKDGTLRRHRDLEAASRPRCPGSEMAPIRAWEWNRRAGAN